MPNTACHKLVRQILIRCVIEVSMVFTCATLRVDNSFRCLLISKLGVDASVCSLSLEAGGCAMFIPLEIPEVVP